MHISPAILIGVITAGASGQNKPPRWYKGNTHTHTLWSDGDGAPELVADWYRARGYAFLVLSDHNILSVGERWFPVTDDGRLTPALAEDLRRRFGADAVDVRPRADGGLEMRLQTLEELRARFEETERFLFIQGEEITDEFERIPVHVNGLHLAEVIPPQGGTSIVDVLQRNVDAVIAQGRRLGRPTLAHINHPNFGWALRPEHIAAVQDERFFEVYNGHPGVRNHGDAERVSTEAMWDLALVARLTELDLGLLYGLATDDAHHYHTQGSRGANPGRGWVMVRALRLEPAAIIAALKSGDFYASSGVRLLDVTHDEASLTVHIETEPGAEYTTRFIGTRLVDGEPGEIGKVLYETESNPAVYEFQGAELYVRATVVSSQAHPNPHAPGDRQQAWVQPVLVARP